MGRFVYDSTTKIDFDDRLLAHLQAVILAKVRRGEAFSFTWKEDVSTGGGRTSVYINGHSSLQFKYYGSRQPQISPAWLHALTFNANSPRGLYVVPEPDAATVDAARPRETVFGEVIH